MAQPYQDLQGNWFIAGRPMSPQELALSQAAQANSTPAPQPMAPAPKPAPQGQPAPVAPKPAQVDPLQAAMAAEAKRKQIGLNPIGAGIDFLFGK